MRRAGITPVVLSGKDGLALISANGVSIGQAALVVARAEQVVDAADVAAALSMEATGANPRSCIPPCACQVGPWPGDGSRPYPEPVEEARCSPAGLDGTGPCRSGSYRRSGALRE